MIRKLAVTEVPMMPPILLKAPNLELIAEAVAATITEVIMTILAGEDFIRGFQRKERTWCDKKSRAST